MTLTNNYFRCAERLYFFVDTIPESIESAFEIASLTGETVTIFRPCPIAGPWDRLPIVGHRSRGAILKDIAAEEAKESIDVGELLLLNEELKNYDNLFHSVGRDTVPLQVAA